MPGETWKTAVQIGKEVTAGTAVAATRKMYYREPTLTRTLDPRPHEFATATRDNVRAFTTGPEAPGGQLVSALSSSEIIEPLLLCVKGGVTPTQPDSVGAPTVRLWTFTPGTSLDSATIEWDDGARPWRQAGGRVNQLTIAGSVLGENIVTAELLGMKHTQNALTGALTDRTPDFIEGWQSKIYIDAFNGTPGTTNIAGFVINWQIRIMNNMIRKYYGDNTKNVGSVNMGKLAVTAELTLEAEKAQALTEFNNWDAATPTKRLIRLEFQDESGFIQTTFRRFVTIDLPGAWSAFDFGQTDAGTRVYRLSYQYVYDSTNAFGIQVRAQNNRATAY